MKTHLIIGLIFSGLMCLTKPSTAQSALFNSQTPQIICESNGLNGELVLRGFGIGKNKKAAKEVIMKNALYALMFQGTDGTGNCEQQQLIFDANAYEKERRFFNHFFSAEGDYKNFVTADGLPRRTTRKYKAEGRQKLFSLLVKVNVGELENYLVSKGLVK